MIIKVHFYFFGALDGRARDSYGFYVEGNSKITRLQPLLEKESR